MTSKQMKDYFHQSNLIEGYDSKVADEQSAVAWDYLSEVNQLDDHCIQKVQKIITLFQTDLQPDWRGYYRKIDVWIGGHKALRPEFIDLRMASWLNSLGKISPKASHIDFEHIHPFVDGNGRTGRMLMWWMEINQGKKPTLILNSKKQDYYKWFK